MNPQEKTTKCFEFLDFMELWESPEAKIQKTKHSKKKTSPKGLGFSAKTVVCLDCVDFWNCWNCGSSCTSKKLAWNFRQLARSEGFRL